jgi:hypothetical protein
MSVDGNYELWDGWEMQFEADKELEIERLAKVEMEREMEKEREDWEKMEEERKAAEMTKRQREKDQGRRPTKKGGGKTDKNDGPTDREMPPSKVKLRYKKKQAFGTYCGSYEPFIRENPMKSHSMIPNAQHPSSHFPIVAKFRFSEGLLSGMWHGGQEEEEDQ